MRNGSGDEMLLRRGDTWHESLGTWTKSGRSASEPIVIGAYGSGPRPTVATGSGRALVTGSNTYRTVNHLAIMGIRFYADARDPDSPTYRTSSGDEGIRITSATDDLLIEDCCVEGYTTNVNLYQYYGRISNVRIRRSQILDSYSTTAHSQGLFAYGVDGLTLDGNVFDHNGWNTSVAGAGQTMYNHDAYIKENVTGFTARGNLFANAASHGMQARAGGNVENNVFLNDPIGLSFGLVNGSPVKAGGVSGSVRDNVFLGSCLDRRLVPRVGRRGGEYRAWRGDGRQRQRLRQQPDRLRLRDQPRVRQRRDEPRRRGGHQRPDDRRQRRLQLDAALNLVSGLVPGGTGCAVGEPAHGEGQPVPADPERQPDGRRPVVHAVDGSLH